MPKIVLIESPTGEKKITSFKYPPMGLLAVASFLDKRGYQITIIDAAIDNLTVDDIVKKTIEIDPKYVGISSMSANISQTFETAEKLKKYNPDIKVIVGGVHPTVMPEHTLSCSSIDVAVMGEGEITAMELLQALENNQNIDNINGIAFKKADDLFINPRRELIEDLDSLPIPNYDFLEIYKYKSNYAKRTPFMNMVRSRGCVFNCTFCANPKIFGRTFRCQSPQRTITEIDYLVSKYGIKEISFKDTELTLDKNLEEFCDLLIEKNYDLIWCCNGRVSNVNEHLLKKMKRAGCYSITFGVESGNQEILNHIKKGITLDQVKKAIDAAKNAKLQVVTNFMIGNPHDTKETIQQTIDFAIELDTDYTYFGFTTPFPGTELREQAEENGWILDKSMGAIQFNDCMMNATSLPTEELKTYLDKAYRAFYFRPKYILRRLLRLNKNEIKNSWNGLKTIIKNSLRIQKKN